MLAAQMAAQWTPVAQRIAARIAPYLGPETARFAVTTFAQRQVGRGPEHIELEDAATLLAALRPVLRTFVGNSSCEILLRRIQRDLGL
jgi:hypothetical protein